MRVVSKARSREWGRRRVSSERRVLLIDDDEDDRLLTREFFEEFDERERYGLEWAGSFEEGLEKLKEESYQVCLLDYRLGVQDGIELMEKARRENVQTPIILLTGQGDEEIDREAMQKGAADYLVKGEITAALLERAIRHALERHRGVQSERFLATAGVRLTSSLDYEETLESVAELSAEFLADYCAIDVIDEEGRSRRLKVGVGERGRESMGKWLHRNPFFDSQKCLARRTLASGKAFLVSPATPEILEELATTEERKKLLGELAPVALMSVPMVTRDQLLGSILFISAESGHLYDQRDLVLAEQLGFRAALAAENARLYQEAKRAVELRDEVHRIVVHDLRNPLSTMGLAVQLMDRMIDRGMSAEKFRSQLETQRICIRQMNQLIEDLLDVARIESGKLALSRGGVGVGEILEGVIRQHRIQAEDRGIDLKVGSEEEVPVVDVDLRRIQQVLSNLIGNALKFTAEGGEIEVFVKKAIQGEVVFSVRDTGQGIATEAVPRLFDRFWQAQEGSHGGAGLGLAISKGIVEAHGGEIWVESELDRGTVFFFSLGIYEDEEGEGE